MGLFDLFKKKDFKFYLNKCEEALACEDFGDALMNVRKALEKAEGMDEKETARDKEGEIKHLIYENALSQAKQYLRSGQADAAKNAIDRAARYVTNDDERDELNKLIENADHWQEEEQVVEPHIEGEEKVTGLDDDDKWNLYVTSLTFEKAEHCDRLGGEFKKALIDIQEQSFDDAIEKLEKLYHASPENEKDTYIMCELGQAYMGKKDFKKADAILEIADKTADEVETKLLRVQILWALKKYDVAEDVLQSAHDLDPDNAQVLATIAQHGLISGDYQSGIDAVEVLLDTYPKDISVQRLAGRLYQENGDDDKALDCFETVNHLYWQVDPRTHKLSFDQNAAAAAAGIYFKRGEKLDRCVELLEAIRSNSDGETHIAICMQLSEVYEKMGKKSKRTEMLTESTRFMDGMLERLRGPERAMLQLQYSEVCEKLGDTGKETEMIQEARKFFQADAEKGQPAAAFYVDLIDKKLQGQPFPDAKDMRDRMIEFVKNNASSLRANSPQELTRQAVSMNLASAEPVEDDEGENDDDSEVESGGIEPENIMVTATSQDSNAASDFLKAMIRNSGVNLPTITPTIVSDESSDSNDEDSDSNSDDGDDK